MAPRALLGPTASNWAPSSEPSGPAQSRFLGTGIRSFPARRQKKKNRRKRCGGSWPKEIGAARRDQPPEAAFLLNVIVVFTPLGVDSALTLTMESSFVPAIEAVGPLSLASLPRTWIVYPAEVNFFS